MNRLTNGLLGLCSSRKGALSLIIVVAVSILALLGKVEGISYAAVIATVQVLFCWTQSSTDKAAMRVPDYVSPAPPLGPQ